MIASGLGKIIYDKNTYQKQLKEQQLKEQQLKEQQSQPEFQPMPYVKHGGRYENKIEVEGNELRTKNGRITENFYGPSHENGGILTTGNQEDTEEVHKRIVLRIFALKCLQANQKNSPKHR